MKRIAVTIFCLALGLTLKPQSKEIRPNGNAAMHQPRYCLFYDNHTMPACPDVGENFDAEAFTDRIKACGVDYLTFHARCNQGLAYYNTEIGIKHPSLKKDLFGELADACQKKGIALTAYLNGGISHAEGILHREWTTLYFDGREYRETRLTPFVRTMCYNTPYHDHLVSMVEEIARNYPVSGFFIDCLGTFPCICPTCINEMKERGIDWTNSDAVAEFSNFSALRLARDISNAAKAINPNLLLYFNGPGFEEQADIGTYLELECLPSRDWGYEFLPVFSHYMRTLGDKPVLNMNARFYEWGDFGGFRPEAAIKFELLYGLANGMRPNVGGHFHPRGDINNASFDRIEKIYKELQTMEPWFEDAVNLVDIAIVYPKAIGQIQSDPQLQSAVRMLSELKQQFDVVTDYSDWSKYEVLVFPDDIVFNEEVAVKVKAHLDAGKVVISSGTSGLDPEQSEFVFEQDWGVKYLGKNDFNPAYFTVGENYSIGLPDMPLSLYSSGIDMEPLSGTSVEARLIKPYYNKEWNGVYAVDYNPPDVLTEKVALSIHGNIAHFSHRIFTGYSDYASVELRTIFSNVLNSYLSTPLIRSSDLPSFSRVFVTEQASRKMVHILSYVPELRGPKTQMIEEGIELHQVKIALRTDGKIPKKVYLAPENISLPFKLKDGYAEVTIPECKGYSLLVFEE